METELGALVAAWPLARPLRVRPVASGTNNRTVRIESPGGAYLLRVYRNTRDPARVRYEHAVLLALQESGLSFRVPAPGRPWSRRRTARSRPCSPSCRGPRPTGPIPPT